jgi:hypothetical protein
MFEADSKRIGSGGEKLLLTTWLLAVGGPYTVLVLGMGPASPLIGGSC